jgi:hypothetical protein
MISTSGKKSCGCLIGKRGAIVAFFDLPPKTDPYVKFDWWVEPEER